MQQAISWTDLVNKSVAIWGYGVEGKATHERLLSLGVKPLIVDDGLAEASDDIQTFEKSFAALKKCDFVVKSPGISRYSEACLSLEPHTPILGASGLWLASVDASKVICITGTKGKSTTSALCAEILSALGHDVFFGGNIGAPAFAKEAQGGWDYWVIETSSFQVTDLMVGPKVVGFTSLHPDHLPWHGEVETYYRDKLALAFLPGVSHVLANSDDETLAARPELAGDITCWTSAENISTIDPTTTLLSGNHNRSNMALAIKCAEALTGEKDLASDNRVVKAIQEFAGLPHRFQTIGTLSGVVFINDSLSTNVLPTLAALQALPDKSIALIVGGFDRGVDQTELIDYLNQAVNVCAVCIPDTGHDVLQRLTSPAIKADSMVEAVDKAYEWAKKQSAGVVLLSPAAASFNEFKDYQERGEVFAETVNQLVQSAE